MKWYVTVIIIYALLMCLLAFMLPGCSLFQMSSADKIASLPETPQQQLFQTLAKTNWLFTLSIVGVGAGFFAFLNGSSKGLQFMAACFIVISLIIGITRYSAVIAVISIIGTACLTLYSVLVKNKAMREVVQGVELIREDARTDPDNVSTLSDYGIKSLLSDAQSKTTKAIVKKIKAVL